MSRSVGHGAGLGVSPSSGSTAGNSQNHETRGNAMRFIPSYNTSITEIVIFGQQKHSTTIAIGSLSRANTSFVILPILNILNLLKILYFYFSYNP